MSSHKGTPVCAAARGPVSAAAETASPLDCPRALLGCQATFLPPVGSATRSNSRYALPHRSAPQGAQEGRHRRRCALPVRLILLIPTPPPCQLDTNIHLGRITAHNAVHRRQVAEMLKAPPQDFRAGAVAPPAPHKPAELGDPGDGLA